MNKREVIARAIFDYFSLHAELAPYSFEEDGGDLTVNVDGVIYCSDLADAIDAAVIKWSAEAGL